MRFLPLFALLALSAPALAQETPAAAPEKVEKAKPDKNDPNRPICRFIAGTASRLSGGRRECHTRAEWAAMAKDHEGRVPEREDPNVRSQ